MRQLNIQTLIVNLSLVPEHLLDRHIMIKLLLWAAIIVVIIALLYPIEFNITPEWKLKVVNEKGEPIADALVRQYWMHGAVNSDDHQEDFWTDKDGYVVLPKRKVSAPIIHLSYMVCLNILTLGHHSGFRPRSSVTAWSDGLDGYIPYTPDQPPPSQLTLRGRN